MKKALAFGMGLALSGSAFAGFSFTNPGPVSSNGPAGNAVNGILTYNHAGGAFLPGSITLEGDLTETNVGTFASEARVRITNPAGQVFTPTVGFTATSGFTGTIHIGPSSIGGLSSVLNGNSIGTWTFNFFESFDDGSDLLEDASWTNLSISVNDYVPPPPPPATNLGNVVDTSSDYAVADMTANHTGGAIRWYSFTLNSAVDNALATWLDIDSETSNFDTEIGLYTSTGALIASDDDDGSGTQSQLSFGQTAPTRTIGTSVGGNGRDGALGPGTYYIAVGGFNTTFGPDFNVTTTSTNTTGVFNLNIRTNVPEPASLALLALGGLALIRRR